MVVALVVLAAGGAWYWTLARTGDSVRYTTETVVRGDVTVSVTATGTVEPTNQVDISSELSGIVRSVVVNYNDEVSVGQLLATLDTDKLAAEVAHARATLLTKQASLTQARATVQEKSSSVARVRQLVQRNVASQSDLDTAEAEHARALAGVEIANADIDVARASLQIAETNLEKARIVSPINGIVLDRGVDPGQYVASSLQAPVLFTVAEDLRQMELLVDIDEADVGQVVAGQTASFSVDAYPDQTFPAIIRQVRYAPVTADGVVTYQAELTVDNGKLLLRPGMTATSEIIVKSVENGLLVPNAALRFQPPSTESSDDASVSLTSLFRMGPPRIRSASRNARRAASPQVWVLRNGVPVAVDVLTGVTDGQHTEIVGGELAPGDAVIVNSAVNG
ncbi:efflux RND transporter periplasmic adaptor subunit [Breoghania sp. L-A4]|uniref:efflux RND transporter periplasmic adaptor subunit n=1 Tax=Breoghania sp. L-A4 TaxID=2304600 RepID=UPI000E360B9D|nr:efflux RND transporter periplasmic adaptor subunit [Breoghania sp. L-A4]AXS41240.1 efflux RND transporter periplasmic adaptor subunit [Breoghania sp. L-A4]